MEVFEQNYNFRFEEGNGAYITTHQREVEDSMRRKDESRRDKRLEKQQKQEEEKKRRQEELQQLKQLKRDEILEKLRKAEFLAGSKILDETGESKRVLEKVERELKTDFIPELYDKAMEKVFDEKYYEAPDEGASKAAKAKDLTMRLMKDQELEAEEEEEENVQEAYEREITKPLIKQVEQKLEDGQFDTWFACDGCQKPIEGGEYRFDCQTCDNFCFCERCYRRNKDHLHKFSRQKVPLQNKVIFKNLTVFSLLRIAKNLLKRRICSVTHVVSAFLSSLSQFLSARLALRTFRKVIPYTSALNARRAISMNTSSLSLRRCQEKQRLNN